MEVSGWGVNAVELVVVVVLVEVDVVPAVPVSVRTSSHLESPRTRTTLGIPLILISTI